MVELLGGEPSDIVLDKNVAAFESGPLDWEDVILIPAPVLLTEEESDDDVKDDVVPLPSVMEAAAALNVLAEWNRCNNIGVHTSIANLADAIGRARAMAPNGSLDTWLV